MFPFINIKILTEQATLEYTFSFKFTFVPRNKFKQTWALVLCCWVILLSGFSSGLNCRCSKGRQNLLFFHHRDRTDTWCPTGFEVWSSAAFNMRLKGLQLDLITQNTVIKQMFLYKVMEYFIRQWIYMLKILSKKCFTDSTLTSQIILNFWSIWKKHAQLSFHLCAQNLSLWQPAQVPVNQEWYVCSDYILWCRNKAKPPTCTPGGPSALCGCQTAGIISRHGRKQSNSTSGFMV